MKIHCCIALLILLLIGCHEFTQQSSIAPETSLKHQSIQAFSHNAHNAPASASNQTLIEKVIKIEKQLDSQIDHLVLKDISLRQAISRIAKEHEWQLLINWEAFKHHYKINPEQLVSLKQTGMSTEATIQQLFKQVTDTQVHLISTPWYVELDVTTHGEMDGSYYDISPANFDIQYQLDELFIIKEQLTSTGLNLYYQSLLNHDQERYKDEIAQLIDKIMTTHDHQDWKEAGGTYHQLRPHRERLILSAPLYLHRRVAKPEAIWRHYLLTPPKKLSKEAAKVYAIENRLKLPAQMKLAKSLSFKDAIEQISQQIKIPIHVDWELASEHFEFDPKHVITTPDPLVILERYFQLMLEQVYGHRFFVIHTSPRGIYISERMHANQSQITKQYFEKDIKHDFRETSVDRKQQLEVHRRTYHPKQGETNANGTNHSVRVHAEHTKTVKHTIQTILYLYDPDNWNGWGSQISKIYFDDGKYHISAPLYLHRQIAYPEAIWRERQVKDLPKNE